MFGRNNFIASAVDSRFCFARETNKPEPAASSNESGGGMIHTRKPNLAFAGLLLFAFSLGPAERYFGEPVQLNGRALYFTSWKHVRQGSFSWRVQVDANASEAERNIGAWLKGDGNHVTRSHRPAQVTGSSTAVDPRVGRLGGIGRRRGVAT